MRTFSLVGSVSWPLSRLECYLFHNGHPRSTSSPPSPLIPIPAARPKQSPRATAGLSVWLLLTVDGHLGNVVLPDTKITAPFLSSVRFKDFLPRPWTGNTTSRGNQDFTSVMDCSPMACLGHTGLSEWPTVYLTVTDCPGNEHCAVIKRRLRQCTQWMSTCHG